MEDEDRRIESSSETEGPAERKLQISLGDDATMDDVLDLLTELREAGVDARIERKHGPQASGPDSPDGPPTAGKNPPLDLDHITGVSGQVGALPPEGELGDEQQPAPAQDPQAPRGPEGPGGW